jgi:hypothetical protein
MPSRQDTADRHDRLIRELNEERAAALRRIGGRLDALIALLHDTRARLTRLDGEARARELARYADLRRSASRYRWYLEVQRESLGLSEHGYLDECYAIPGPLDA